MATKKVNFKSCCQNTRRPVLVINDSSLLVGLTAGPLDESISFVASSGLTFYFTLNVSPLSLLNHLTSVQLIYSMMGRFTDNVKLYLEMKHFQHNFIFLQMLD